MSTEEYEELVFLLTYGTEEDKEFAINYIFSYTENNSSVLSWNSTLTTDMGDGTYSIRGFVTSVHSYYGMSVRAVVAATMRGNNQYGYTWTSIGPGEAIEGHSGMYEFDGIIDYDINSPTQIYIGIAGNFTITEEKAHSFGISLEVFEESYSISNTMYYRHYYTASHVENSSIHIG